MTKSVGCDRFKLESEDSMTTEKERKFFEWAGIEPKCLDEEYSGCKYADDDNRNCCIRYKNKSCNYSNLWIYPPITSDIILELIEIILMYSNEFHIDISKNEYGCNCGHTGGYYQDNFKHCILSLLMELPDLKPQVQKLFRKD